MTNLFQWGKFKSAAGLDLDWKIECDALGAKDWQCLAHLFATLHSNGWYADRFNGITHILPVPHGGTMLARELARAIKLSPGRPRSYPLIVDDVWTTGQSMLAVAKPHAEWAGMVVFARGPLPSNVVCLFKVQVEMARDEIERLRSSLSAHKACVKALRGHQKYLSGHAIGPVERKLLIKTNAALKALEKANAGETQ